MRLPTRAVDCTDPDHPRLVSTDGRLGKYLALSYVWGEAQPHQTSKANIAAYSAGIDAALLPQTIRDAIHTTHALGFQYLWADSLCIIQDSDEDKLHELGRMHLVYRYAYVTIDAANAKRVRDGFLQERPEPPRITLPFIFPPHPRQGGQRLIGSVHLSAQNKRIYSTAPTTGTRGWCLQEYLMSPRSLIFTSETVHFRCQTAITNVLCAFYYKPDHLGWDRRLPPALFHADPPHLEHDSDAWRELHSAWWRIVGDYTQRALGVPSDKLIACGAVAAVFHGGLRSDYLAGLWRGPALLTGLLWENRCISSFLQRPMTYRAPSWSWAAVDGGVTSLALQLVTTPTAVAEVLDCQIELKNPELPFGQVVGGFVVLRARLVPCTRRRYGALRPDTMMDAATARSDGAWLVPIFTFDIPSLMRKKRGVAGLVVTLAGPDDTRSRDGLGKIYRRIGVFSEDSPWDDWRLMPLVEVKLI